MRIEKRNDFVFNKSIKYFLKEALKLWSLYTVQCNKKERYRDLAMGIIPVSQKVLSYYMTYNRNSLK